MHAVLLAAGLPASHEIIYNGSGIDLNKQGTMQIEVSWLGARYLHVLPGDFVIWQIVRHPMLVARSLRNMKVLQSKGTHMQQVLAVLGPMFLTSSIPELDFWILWNRIIEIYASRRFRVEDVDELLVKDIGRIFNQDIRPTDTLKTTIGLTEQYGGHYRDPVAFDLENYENLQTLHTMAEKYGYDLYQY